MFGDKEAVSTREILQSLIRMDEAPWGDLRGKEIDARKLSQLLRPYGVERTTFRDGQTTVKGYTRESLHDPWLRYLGSPQQPSDPVTAVTGVTRSGSVTDIREHAAALGRGSA